MTTPKNLSQRQVGETQVVLYGLMKEVFENAIAHGFYTPAPSDLERIALIHSELSEAVEAVRHGNPPDNHIPEFSGLEAELADVVIRCLDYAAYKKLRLPEAILAKMAYNEARPYKHGKAC